MAAARADGSVGGGDSDTSSGLGDGEVRVRYHSSILYDEDLAALRPLSWLTDNVLCFWMEHLAHRVFPEHAAEIAFVHPATAFMALFEEGEDLAAALAALRLHEKSLLLVPVNDNPYADAAAGGSHWTLLSWRRPPSAGVTATAAGSGAGGSAWGEVPLGFAHWDSARAGSRNGAVAGRLAAALFPLLHPPAAGGGSGGGSGGGAARVTHMTCWQQTNGADCGVFTLLYAGSIAAAHAADALARGDGVDAAAARHVDHVTHVAGGASLADITGPAATGGILGARMIAAARAASPSAGTVAAGPGAGGTEAAGARRSPSPTASSRPAVAVAELRRQLGATADDARRAWRRARREERAAARGAAAAARAVAPHGSG